MTTEHEAMTADSEMSNEALRAEVYALIETLQAVASDLLADEKKRRAVAELAIEQNGYCNKLTDTNEMLRQVAVREKEVCADFARTNVDLNCKLFEATKQRDVIPRADYIENEIDRLAGLYAALRALLPEQNDLLADEKERRDVAERALEQKGCWKTCMIPACNCGDQWAHGGHADERLSELSYMLEQNAPDPNGKTLREELASLITERDAACEELRALKRANANSAVLWHSQWQTILSLGAERDSLTAANATLAEKLLVANRAIDSLEDDLGIAQCDLHDPIPS